MNNEMRANVSQAKSMNTYLKRNEIPNIELLEGEEEWVMKVVDLPTNTTEAVISKTSPKNLPQESDD